MRYTEADLRVRDIPGGELWLGTVADPHPHVVFATRAQEDQNDEDDLVVVWHLEAGEAMTMAHELKRLALTIAAPNN